MERFRNQISRFSLTTESQIVIEEIEERICLDRYVGIVSEMNAQNRFHYFDLSERPESIPCIILIMESPHIQEYIDIVAPAKGRTGGYIRTKFNSVVGFDRYSEYGLILMNAIQYQCSLGKPTTQFRDEVFKFAWNEVGESNFRFRLRNTILENDVVVNCCTKGHYVPYLRTLVQSAIENELQNDMNRILNRTHPSSWFSLNNRNFEWI